MRMVQRDQAPSTAVSIRSSLNCRRSIRPVVIAVDDVKDAMKHVTEAGGKVLGEPMLIPGVGQYVSFTDTEGNRVSMLQPIPRS